MILTDAAAITPWRVAEVIADYLRVKQPHCATATVSDEMIYFVLGEVRLLLFYSFSMLPRPKLQRPMPPPLMMNDH